MKRDRAPLGELCALVKGTSPISKTLPGPYPLVTTGEAHKFADSFQLDAEAVCIPLISSTGHGHASLKRVHYQTGKFALANLIAAALVKDSSVLSAKFLTRYLMFNKDRLIVPLMTGAANMSISIGRLATVPIEFPSLAEQERIVKLLDDADELRKLRAAADRRSADLIPALFHEIFGDPVTNSMKWPVTTIGEIAPVETGRTPNRALPENFDGAIPWIKTTEVNGRVITETEEGLSEEGFRSVKGKLFPRHSLIVAMYGQGKTRGQCGVLGIEAFCNQACAVILPSEHFATDFLFAYIQISYERLRALARGGNQENLNLDIVRSFKLPLPPLPLQKEFAQRVSEIRALQAAQAASRQRTEHLFQSMLHRAFNQAL